MNRRFHYLLGFFIIMIVYLFYSIIQFKVKQFQNDTFTQTIKNNNQELEARNKRKETEEKYIRTKAYQTQVAKATQNKKLPGEDVINIITQADIDGNANIDSQEVFSEAKKKDDPTIKMSNPERWQYLFQKGIPQ